MTIAVVIYVGVAAVFTLLTLDEGERRELPWGPMRIGGLFLCALWPILLLIAGVPALWRAITRQGLI